MTDTTTATPETPFQAVLKQSDGGFAPRTRKATSDALVALKPSLDAVKSVPDMVFTIVEDVTPAKAASLVSLLNARYDNKWTFGGRSTDDGTAIVQARYSEKPENTRPVRKVNRKNKAPKGKAKTADLRSS